MGLKTAKKAKVQQSVELDESPNDFSQLVKSAREARYSSPFKFHKQADLSCSYFYYTSVEKGKIPSVEVAMAIIEALKINKRIGLFAWTRAQMPDAETKAMFVELGEVTLRSSEQESTNRSLVLNRMQAKLISDSPVYWELMVYVSSYYPRKSFDAEAIASQFQLDSQTIAEYLDELFDYGMLERNDESKYYSKEWVYIPYEKEFVKIRDANFDRAFEQFKKTNPNDGFRTTVTRRVHPDQKAELNAYLEAFQNHIIDMKDEDDEAAVPYTVGIFASERVFGDA